MTIEPKIVFSPDYDIRFFGLEKLHPFDSCKYSRARATLRTRFGKGVEDYLIHPGAPVARRDLEMVHTPAYLDRLRSSAHVAGVLEMPIVAPMPIALVGSHVLKPMRLATAGTVRAFELALQGGLAINLSGGYHHASADRGEGFCVYGDVALAVAKLRESGALVRGRDSILYVDLDAHQGNGVTRFFRDDRDVFILDVYNADIYPRDRDAIARIDVDVPISSGTSDSEYLAKLRNALGRALRNCSNSRLAVYNAGTDVYQGDSLGRLNLSAAAVLERDKMVLDTLTGAGIPCAMVLSGGYSKDSYSLIAAAVGYVLERWGSPI
jgi:histone deacetylase 11